MELEFVKMHGCGNDYIYLDCRTIGLPQEVSRWAVELSPGIPPWERTGSSASARP